MSTLATRADIKRAVGIWRLGLVDHHRAKRTGAAQTRGRLCKRLWRKGFSCRQAGNGANTRGAHPAWRVRGLNLKRAKAQARAGREGDVGIKGVAGMIGGNRLARDIGLGMARIAPGAHTAARGLADQVTAGPLAADKLVWQLCIGRHGRHTGDAKEKFVTPLHGDINLADLAGRAQRRDAGGLCPIDANADHAAIIALGVKHPDQPGIIRLRGGQ